MTLKEMQSCASETLAYFLQIMPNVPFSADDVDIQFAAKKDIVARFKDLCAQCAPERLRSLTDSHFDMLESQIFGNAIIGKSTSAVVVRINYKIERDNLRRILFHELMHIYCAKTEMDSKQFIDIYGTGHTPDPDPADREYDGCVNAGYAVWSEFIAEYYAIIKTMKQRFYYDDIVEYTFSLLAEVHIANENRKTDFSMLCTWLLSCVDCEDALAKIAGISDGSPEGIATVEALRDCLTYLCEHMQQENPCHITEDFVYTLGRKHLMFTLQNSQYLGLL